MWPGPKTLDRLIGMLTEGGSDSPLTPQQGAELMGLLRADLLREALYMRTGDARSNMAAELNLEALREGVKGIDYGTAELHLEAMSAFILRQIERVEACCKCGHVLCVQCHYLKPLRADLLRLQKDLGINKSGG